MTELVERHMVAQRAIVHPEVSAFGVPHQVDRNFELPTRLYALTALGYLGFLAVTAMAFGDPGLILPMAIFVIFIAMFFGVPAMWVRMKPDNPQRAMGWNRFLRDGIQTATGRLTAKEATVQVLILPALIFVWGLAVVTVAALR